MALVGTSLIDAPSFIGGGSGLAFSSTISGLGSETGAIANGDTLLAALAKINDRLPLSGGTLTGDFTIGSSNGLTLSNVGGTGKYRLQLAGTTRIEGTPTAFALASGTKLGFSSTSYADAGALDTYWSRANAAVMALRNGSTAHELQIYGDHTDASNYARLVFRTAAGDYTIAAEAAGGGTLRNLLFNGANRVAKINDVAGTPSGSNATIISDLQAAVAYLIDMGEAWGLASTS